LIEGATGDSCEAACGLTYLGPHTGCTLDAITWAEGIYQIADWIDANPYSSFLNDIHDNPNHHDHSNLILSYPP